jgi:RHS repeat-associated protein
MEQKRNTYFFHADGLGSIVNLTDQRGRVVQSYEYSSFGRMKEQGGEVKQPYGFTGREWDKELGLYYYRARYYDPKAGRFISKDPIGFAGGDVNLYRYVGNDSVNWVDPSGLFRWHGNWGGPGWTAGQFKPESQLTNSDLSTPAIDARDTCYKDHDICIWKDECNIKSCDHQLASCLRNISPFNIEFWLTSQGYPVEAAKESIGFDTFIPYIVHR